MEENKEDNLDGDKGESYSPHFTKVFKYNNHYVLHKQK